MMSSSLREMPNYRSVFSQYPTENLAIPVPFAIRFSHFDEAQWKFHLFSHAQIIEMSEKVICFCVVLSAEEH